VEQELSADLDHFVTHRGAWRLLLELLHAVTQLIGLIGHHGPGVLAHSDLNSGAGDVGFRDVRQKLAAELEFDRGPPLSACRQRVSEVRDVLRECSRAREQDGAPPHHSSSFNRPAPCGATVTSTPSPFGSLASGSM